MAMQKTPRPGKVDGTGKAGSTRRRALPDARKVCGSGTVHRLRILLSESDPPVWREIEVLSDTSFDRLHRIFQAAMGWCDGHRHQFLVEEECIADPEAVESARDESTVRLHRVAPEKGATFLYVYDLGDDWQHEVTVEAVHPRTEATSHPRCTGGSGACPPEDCGGIPGYEDLLRVLRDPSDEEHAAMCELVGDHFDPALFDLAAVNRRMKQIR
jgi:hypothetical protein